MLVSLFALAARELGAMYKPDHPGHQLSSPHQERLIQKTFPQVQMTPQYTLGRTNIPLAISYVATLIYS